MLLKDFLIFLVLSSANKRSRIPNPKMLSQTFAHIHNLSFNSNWKFRFKRSHTWRSNWYQKNEEIVVSPTLLQLINSLVGGYRGHISRCKSSLKILQNRYLWGVVDMLIFPSLCSIFSTIFKIYREAVCQFLRGIQWNNRTNCRVKVTLNLACQFVCC